MENFKEATFFHSAAWARVLSETYGFKPNYVGVFSGSVPQAVCPMMEVDSLVSGRRGVSLPFTDECGPLVNQAGAFNSIWDQFLAVAQQRRWKYIEWRGGKSRFASAKSSTSFYGHRLDLRKGEALLFKGFRESTRNALRKAESSGLSITTSRDLESIQEFYRLMGKTRQRHGLPIQPWSFFREIFRHVLKPGLGCVILVKHKEKPIAGAVYFYFRKTVIYKFGASDQAYQNLRGNNLVTGEAIRRHAAEGFETFDFGRTSMDNFGLRKFKLSWGTEEHLIDYVRYDPARSAYVIARDQTGGWKSGILRLLPIFCLRVIGKILYRHAA